MLQKKICEHNTHMHVLQNELSWILACQVCTLITLLLYSIIEATVQNRIFMHKHRMKCHGSLHAGYAHHDTLCSILNMIKPWTSKEIL